MLFRSELQKYSQLLIRATGIVLADDKDKWRRIRRKSRIS